jgi:hypothetical protein
MLDIKVGDQVFVVHQKSRHQTERRAELKTVTKVGREYGYIGDMKFSLRDGMSSHKDHNARCNGFGFDVYKKEQDYLDDVLATSEYKRLGGRLLSTWHGLKPLPAEVVNKIHLVLDEHKGGL